MGQDFWLGVAAGAGALLLLIVMVLLTLGGSRLGLGLKTLFRTFRDAKFAEKVQPLLAESAGTPKPAKPSGAPLRLFALLQREGRLFDFLTEDISAAPDAQVGFGVRELHKQCQGILKKTLELEPVLNGEQDAEVEVPAGFDPSAIRVTGNVAGSPPFKGLLKHPGWRVKKMSLAAPPEGVDEFVLMPAEVEVQ
jgi:hypothetical protein